MIAFFATKTGRALLRIGGPIVLAVVVVLGFFLWLAAHDARVAEEARRGYVTLVEKTALENKLKEAKRQRNEASLALEEHRRRLAAAERLDAQQSEEREQEIMAYEIRLSQANRQCLLDRDDIDFLRRP